MEPQTNMPEDSDDYLAMESMERQFRQLRPRSPHVDLEAISNALQPIVLTDALNTRQGIAIRPDRGAWRFFGALAASWAVGIAFGAGGMFYGVNRGGVQARIEPIPTHEAPGQEPLLTQSQPEPRSGFSNPMSSAIASGSTLPNATLVGGVDDGSFDIEKAIGPFATDGLDEVLLAGDHLRNVGRKMIAAKTRSIDRKIEEQISPETELGSQEAESTSTFLNLRRSLMKLNET